MKRRQQIDEIAVTVAAQGAVPVFCVSLPGRDVYLYQRDDCRAWLPIFPGDRRMLASPGRRPTIDLPRLLTDLFPQLIRQRAVAERRP